MEMINDITINHDIMKVATILNQAHGQKPHTPGLLKLIWLPHWYVCVCVSVSALEGINNQWRDMV